MPSATPRYQLIVLVLSQFAGTSVWFAGNAVLPQLSAALGLTPSTAFVTSAVQFGFICGTLVFSLLGIADRVGANSLFLLSSLIAAALNLSMLRLADDNTSLYILRALTGFFLAGIYPVGMKIAADLFRESLGRAMGLLVGALVLGTAFPHLLQTALQTYSYTGVIGATSVLCLLGGISVFFLLPVSKVKAARAGRLSLSALFSLPGFKAAAFGYFGHMWELYAFWTFVPLFIRLHNGYMGSAINPAFWSFLIIGSGFAGCVAGGLLAKKVGSMTVARTALCLSGLFCIASPLIATAGAIPFVVLMCLWGVTAAADSPQFSTLVAQVAPSQNRGTALTLVTCIGFAITVVGIQAAAYTMENFGRFGMLVLAIGPAFGILATRRAKRKAAPLAS